MIVKNGNHKRCGLVENKVLALVAAWSYMVYSWNSRELEELKQSLLKLLSFFNKVLSPRLHPEKSSLHAASCCFNS